MYDILSGFGDHYLTDFKPQFGIICLFYAKQDYPYSHPFQLLSFSFLDIGHPSKLLAYDTSLSKTVCKYLSYEQQHLVSLFWFGEKKSPFYFGGK